MQVRDVMTADPYGVQRNEQVQYATQLMKRHGVGAVLVYDYDQLAGILTDRDIAIECTAAGHNPNECPAGEHMTGNPVSIDAAASADEALDLMGRAQVRRLPVTEDGRCVGIVALGDLAVRMPDRAEVAQAIAGISQPVRVHV